MCVTCVRMSSWPTICSSVLATSGGTFFCSSCCVDDDECTWWLLWTLELCDDDLAAWSAEVRSNSSRPLALNCHITANQFINERMIKSINESINESSKQAIDKSINHMWHMLCKFSEAKQHSKASYCWTAMLSVHSQEHFFPSPKSCCEAKDLY